MQFEQHGQKLLVRTPAKLNLHLEVLRRRDDGFHELETVMVAIDLFDELTFADGNSDDVDLRLLGISPTGIPTDDGNLIVRAAHLLQQQTGVRRGVSIGLRKRIPSEAGLAGGSSDAAAALHGLNRFWELHLSHSHLMELAGRLGSDIPFFVAGNTAAVCRGRGELVEPISVGRQLDFVVVKPEFGLSTPAVFDALEVPTAPLVVDGIVEGLKAGQPGKIRRLLMNRLAAPAMKLNATISRLCDRLKSLHAHGGLMTGSGSSCFLLCDSHRRARTLANRLRNEGLGRVFAAHSC